MATIEVQVAASYDDSRRGLGGGNWQPTNANNLAGYSSSGSDRWGSGMRFLNVQIPKGATITAAYIKLYCYGNQSVNTVNTRLRAQAHDNAPIFSTVEEFDARTWTTAYSYWDAIPAWTSGNWYQSPDIKASIQEVVNRASWASGNAMAILWDDFEDRSTHLSACYRYGYAYNGSVPYAPILHIEFIPDLHIILECNYASQSQGVNKAYVIGRDANGDPVYGESTDSTELALVGERLEFQLETEIPTAALAADVAAAILAKRRLSTAEGHIVIPPNCGVELWDVVQVTDTPANQSAAKYRISGIRFEYSSKQARFQHRLTLVAP